MQENITSLVNDPNFFADLGVSIKDRADYVVKDHAKYDVLRAVGVLTYVNNLQAQVASHNAKVAKPALLTKHTALASPEDHKAAESEALDEQIWNAEIEYLRQIDSKYDGEVDITSDEAWKERSQRDEAATSGRILRYIRRFNEKLEPVGEFVRVGSPHLRNVLKEVIKLGNSDFISDLNSHKKLDIKVPCWPLFHYREELQDRSKDLTGLEKDHTEVLLAGLETMFPSICQAQKELEEDKVETIDRKFLWLLYPPGSTVYSKIKDDWVAYTVESVVAYTEKLSRLSLNGLAFAEGKAQLKTVSKPVWLEGPTETVSLSDLEAFPESRLPDGENIRKTLLERGKLYWSFADGPVYRQYGGDAWPQRDALEPLQIIIDVRQGYVSSPEEVDDEERAPGGVPGCDCADCSRARRKTAVTRADRHLVGPVPAEEELLRCPATISAYSLRMKSSEVVELRNITPIQFDSAAWDRLVVPDAHKELVTAMVESYGNKKIKMKDLVRGKGQGLVLLLHGPPGVGKTLTAECVAEHQERPLIMITCGDLGTEPVELERNLHDAFRKATRWDAILLLDEADVFLQERDMSQLQRNALVSVFLREIEYFDGILFLTTNRPGLLDEAFQSCIHLTLSLPPLSEIDQLRVWRLFLFEGRKGADLTADETKLLGKIKKKTAGRKLNGRQIRNHVLTASALANKKGKDRQTMAEIEQVLDVHSEFVKYMSDLNLADNDTRARDLGLRLQVAQTRA